MRAKAQPTSETLNKEWVVNKFVWTRAIFYLPLSSGQKLVLTVLASFADTNGKQVFPSIATIAACASLSPRSVQRRLKELRAGGYIARVGKTKSGTWQYRINTEKIIADGIPSPQVPFTPSPSKSYSPSKHRLAQRAKRQSVEIGEWLQDMITPYTTADEQWGSLADMARNAQQAGLASAQPVDTAAHSREILNAEYADDFKRRRVK